MFCNLLGNACKFAGAAYDGFGIGLSIVRRIVDHHGGEVWADGVPGGGATFWFTLGRQQAPAPAQTPIA